MISLLCNPPPRKPWLAGIGRLTYPSTNTPKTPQPKTGALKIHLAKWFDPWMSGGAKFSSNILTYARKELLDLKVRVCELRGGEGKHTTTQNTIVSVLCFFNPHALLDPSLSHPRPSISSQASTLLLTPPRHNTPADHGGQERPAGPLPQQVFQGHFRPSLTKLAHEQRLACQSSGSAGRERVAKGSCFIISG